MYKVLLVDDEPIIRQGLRSIIDWNGCGFEVVGDASDGYNALKKHKELTPDLIIIDIRMPGMDGIQVIKEVRKTDKRCRFIIISGYSDFSYAKQAIAHGVDGYVMKPVDEDEIQAELARIRAALDKETELTRKFEHAAGLRREELICTLLEEEPENIDLLEQELYHSSGGKGKVYQIVLAEFAERREAKLDKNGSMKQKWSEEFGKNGIGYVFLSYPYIGILLKGDLAQHSYRNDIARRLLEAQPGVNRLTIVAGKAVCSLRDIKRSYKGALRLMERSFHLNGHGIHLENDSPQSEREMPHQLEEPDLDALALKLYHAVDIGRIEGVEGALAEADKRIVGYDGSETYIKKSFTLLLSVVFNKIAVVHHQKAVEDFIPLIAELYRQSRFIEMMELIRKRLIELTSRLCNESNLPMMKQVFDFIHRHYYENLKLETLAELYNYNSGYLGKMFKRQTGENFNTYLDKVRIQHAIELLGTGLKVRQVSDRVGYTNVDYFHIKFKKYTGVSPSSFKGSVSEVRLLTLDSKEAEGS